MNRLGDDGGGHGSSGNNGAAPAAPGAGLVRSAVTLCEGTGAGEILRLGEPLSFWGGTDLATGVITDVHHPQHGVSLAGRVVVMSASRGSSSSSSVLAEQIRAGVAPAAMILTSRDAIVALGALAAAEVYGTRMPIVLLDPAGTEGLPRDGRVLVVAGESGATISAMTGREDDCASDRSPGNM